MSEKTQYDLTVTVDGTAYPRWAPPSVVTQIFDVGLSTLARRRHQGKDDGLWRRVGSGPKGRVKYDLVALLQQFERGER